MSDLGGPAGTGRASNGGARTAGPVPVPGGNPPTIRTPTQIMKDRQKRAEQRAEEQRRIAEEQQRRRMSAEQRAEPVTRGGNRSSQHGPNPPVQPSNPNDRRSRDSGGVSGAAVLGQPPGRLGEVRAANPTRESGSSRQDAPRANVPAPRRTQQNQPGVPRPSAAQQVSARVPGVPTVGDIPADASSSSFPHAFERWENLSSHWEGLTSYWLHRLEQNTEEIRETIPNASTLNRQITDLSAAGANLFHAVVELQRLRASSERKFQRWFFETRAENERNAEIRAGLERSLEEQKNVREKINRDRGNDTIKVENAEREVQEVRRELMIAKDEARRAWEELGRRNQESLDTAQSLKEGRMTVVAGVQVVPYFGQPSRTESISQRPVTRDGQGYTGTGLGTAPGAGMQSPSGERQYYREGPSPTNTDPFTDSGRQHGASRGPSQYQPQGVGEALAGAASAPSAGGQYRRSGDRSHVTSGDAERFYQHAGSNTLLHSPESSRAQAPATASHPRDDVRSEASFVDTVSEGGTEYAIDSLGNIQRDDQGIPIIFQRRRGSGGGRGTGRGVATPSSSAAAAAASNPLPRPPQTYEEADDDDDFDTEETIRQHERELAAQYSSGVGAEEEEAEAEAEAEAAQGARRRHHVHVDDDDQDDPHPPEAPSAPFASRNPYAQLVAAPAPVVPTSPSDGYPPPLPPAGPADYEGSGFDNWEDRVRGATTHHHPTRLSDVLEEEEERSSRRTAD